MTRLITLLVCFAASIGASIARAEFPDKPLRLIVPLAAGGPSDTAARSLARALAAPLGQQVSVENLPGANGVVGARALQKSPADGYTLIFAPNSMTGLPLLMKASPYASMLEFAPVSAVGGNHMCLYVHPALPARSVAEFVAYAKERPDQLSFGASTPLEFMIATQFMKESGARMVRVPYKGSAQMLPDLVEARLQVAFAPPGVGMAQTKAGRLRMLACSTPQRLPALPEVPTMAEAGLQSVRWPAYHLILAPADTPPAISARLAAAIGTAAQDPALRADYERLQIATDALKPAAVTELIREGERIWAEFVRDAGVQPE
jgi:tripartite-type tricarboxylate transporter receptor subunit TctC